ncbi:MAG: ornithine cyclodeaminase family protein [Alphaproteobacteria bacterium]|nr:ornithine cyclodeaminase family protein [Alphaproteobacteria bacterium]
MRQNAGGLLILSRADVTRLMDFPAYIEAVEAGFRAAAAGRALVPPATGFDVPGGAYHAKAAALLDGPGGIVAVKLNANYPSNPSAHGLPTIQGVIYLADADDGRPLALMDSIEITINRTGAATALAARYLARPDARVATICGAGVQGRIQSRAVAQAIGLERLHVWDIRIAAAQALADELSKELALDVRPAYDLAVARHSDVIVTCTSSRQAFLTPDLVRPGTFVAAVGADNPDKQEIDPALFALATVVVDSLEQCAEIGDLHHALVRGAICHGQVQASLAELVTGSKPGRRDACEITLFDSTGLGLQDVAAAVVAYRRALEAGIGQCVTIN